MDAYLDDRRTHCPIHQRAYWLEDGCDSCRLSRAEQAPAACHAAGTPLAPRSPLSSGGASEDNLICGMHPALAAHTLERCLTAWGGLSGLLVAIQAWEAEPHA